MKKDVFVIAFLYFWLLGVENILINLAAGIYFAVILFMLKKVIAEELLSGQ